MAFCRKEEPSFLICLFIMDIWILILLLSYLLLSLALTHELYRGGQRDSLHHWLSCPDRSSSFQTFLYFLVFWSSKMSGFSFTFSSPSFGISHFSRELRILLVQNSVHVYIYICFCICLSLHTFVHSVRFILALSLSIFITCCSNSENPCLHYLLHI